MACSSTVDFPHEYTSDPAVLALVALLGARPVFGAPAAPATTTAKATFGDEAGVHRFCDELDRAGLDYTIAFAGGRYVATVQLPSEAR